jgi:hypothetical protein
VVASHQNQWVGLREMNLAEDHHILWPGGVALLGCRMRWTKTREGQYSLDCDELGTSRCGAMLGHTFIVNVHVLLSWSLTTKLIVFPEINKEA